MQLVTKTNRSRSLEKEKKLPKLEELEYSILAYSGLKTPDEIKSKDIRLIDDSWMHEVCCGFENKEHIVLLHGYGGCALTFIRLFAPLTQRYHVHALDHMGMGLSGRRVFSD